MNNFMRPGNLIGIAPLLVVLFAQLPAPAEVKLIEDAEGQDGLSVFQMTVTPAAEPRPALKHRLWLRPHELRPGNAVVHYLRCYAENTLNGTWRRINDKYGEANHDWFQYDVSLQDLPLDDVRDASSTFDYIVEQFIQPGTRCRDSDWGLELSDLRGPESLSFPLPDFQQSRSIGRMLVLRTRLAIAERRYDDAIEHLRMNSRLAHDVGQEPLLVCNLIGIAIKGLANTATIELIAAPDSPNLYWALSEVPTPLIDCREAIRLEMSLGRRIFPALMDVETAVHSPGEWARLLAEGIKVYHDLGVDERIAGFNPWFGHEQNDGILRGMVAMGVSLAGYPMAKQRLVDSGMDVERVEAMPVGQVMMVDAAREYRRIAEEYEKWWYVPYPAARERMDEADRAFYTGKSQFGLGHGMASVLLPALEAMRRAQVRSQWKKNALLVIEALRMHAAENGALPRTLEDIDCVPVPKNPITENPYVYRLDGETAILELPFSDGMPGVAWRFEITLVE